MIDRPTRTPDLTGIVGSAWRMTGKSPESPGHLESYLVHRPGAHPAWDGWIVSAVSLRDFPGIEPAYRRYPEAEYEFLVISLDPRHSAPDPDAARPRARHLLPPDVCKQFHGVTDEQVREMVRRAAQAVVGGEISPDQDYRGEWERHIDLMVEHAQGRHHDA